MLCDNAEPCRTPRSCFVQADVRSTNFVFNSAFACIRTISIGSLAGNPSFSKMLAMASSFMLSNAF